MNLLPYQPGYDELSPEEQHLMPRTLKSVQKFIESSAEISKTNYATRDAHSKTYALLRGTFTKEGGLPDFVNNIFSADTQEVIVRLSHANPVVSRSKKEIPAYGFSIQFDNLKGRKANFPLVNFPIFPVKSLADFLRFFTTLNTFLYTKQDNFVVATMDVPFLVKHSGKLLPGLFSWDFVKNMQKLQSKSGDFILSFDYYSVGVFRLGNYMMKLQAVPEGKFPRYGHTLPQDMRIKNFLESHDISYTLLAQLCEDEKIQPVNNLGKEWKNAPTITLGRLTFTKEGWLDPTAPENEGLGFSPFENVEELQPVGRIQQSRKDIYKTSIDTRRKINGIL